MYIKYKKNQLSHITKVLYFTLFTFFTYFSAFAKEKEEVVTENIIPKDQTNIPPILDNQQKYEDKKVEVKGTVKPIIYGGMATSAKFKADTSDKSSFSKFKTVLGMHGYIGAKIEYNIPTFMAPIDFDIKVSFTKKSFEDNTLIIELPLACVQVGNLKAGVAESLFNKLNGVPQISYLYNILPNFSISCSLEASSFKSYFNSIDESDENNGKFLILDDKGVESTTNDNRIWKYTKLEIAPLAAHLQINYKKPGLVDLSLTGLIKPTVGYALSQIEEKENTHSVEGTKLGWGLAFNSKIDLLKSTQVKLMFMVGEGIGSSISDYKNDIILKAEKKIMNHFNNGDDLLAISHDPNLITALRFSGGVIQKITKEFSFSLSYNLTITKEPTEEKKLAHNIHPEILWDLNNEDKFGVSLGSNINPIDNKNMFDISLTVKINV